MSRLGIIVVVLSLLQPASSIAEHEREPGFDAFRNRYYCHILSYLQALYRIPGIVRHRHLIAEPVWRAGRYVQCLIAPDRSNIVCEAASGRWLRPPRPLVATGRLSELLALGFPPEPGDGNYRQSRPLAREADLRDIAELYIRTFYDVYELAPDADLLFKAPLVRRPPIIRQPLDKDCQPYTS